MTALDTEAWAHTVAFPGGLAHCTANIKIHRNKGKRTEFWRRKEKYSENMSETQYVLWERDNKKKDGREEGGTGESTDLPMKAIDLGPGDVHGKPGFRVIRNLSWDKLLDFSEF